MTDPGSDPVLGVPDFYDWLAGEYDRMTSFEARFAKERPVFKHIVDTYAIRTAVDAGAGTGFHSLLLAELGVAVTAIDISEQMLTALQRHAGERGVAIKAARSGFADIAGVVDIPTDALFCLGNGLAHLLSFPALDSALKAFLHVLHPGGLFVLQLLNYRRLLASRDAVVNVNEVAGMRYTRSYTYGPETIRFTISREPLTDPAGAQSESVELRPWTDGELLRRIIVAGFLEPQTYGGMDLGRYDPSTSRDLVILARTPASLP